MMQIPMSSPDITAAEVEAVIRVLQSPHLSLMIALLRNFVISIRACIFPAMSI